MILQSEEEDFLSSYINANYLKVSLTGSSFSSEHLQQHAGLLTWWHQPGFHVAVDWGDTEALLLVGWRVRGGGVKGEG